LRAGFNGRSQRSTANRIFVVMEGTGQTVVGATTFKWSRGDTIVVPTWQNYSHQADGAVAELVGNEVGVVSGVINLESSGVEASDWRPRHDEHYHEA
jgi:gentisate 1,2-dioxygenase